MITPPFVLCMAAACCAAGESPASPGASADASRGPRWRGAAPSVGCWFWSDAEFEPRGYESFLDLHAKHAAYDLLTTSIRYPVEVTDPAVRERIAAAAAYARERGMGVVMDLDVRLARAAFHGRYPGELQELARLRDAPLQAGGTVHIELEGLTLNDHYTFRARPYDAVASRLLRVYAYERDTASGLPVNVEEITSRCVVEQATKDVLAAGIPCRPSDAGRRACVIGAFTLFTPAVFAPHLISFQREILESYAGVPLAGACKDEWGFPGRPAPSARDLWYSRYMAEAYAARRPGEDLAADLFLMAYGTRGRDAERAAAINHYMEMNWQRNAEAEARFFEDVKAVFGPRAFVGTHPTWYPYPGEAEAFKNGLDWWAVPRDLAQTDETAPYAVRTALAKKQGGGPWMNMYYAPSLQDYEEDLWRHVLGGGRMNFHPFWPAEWEELNASLLTGRVLQADARVRLLNLISNASIDCPVAVIFGHPAFLHFAGAGFGDAGTHLAGALWERGLYADLLPSSEVHSGALRLDDSGYLAYGPQRYAAAVLYHPQYERPELAAFFQDAAGRGKTALFRVGRWDRGPGGQPFDGGAALPAEMKPQDAGTVVAAIGELLDAAGHTPQTPCELRALHGFPPSMVPKRSGAARLLDGAVIRAAGERSAMGDPIVETLEVEGRKVSVDAIGLAAVRLDAEGHVEAIACGGLKRFSGPGLEINLSERRDIALWRDPGGPWQGAVLGLEGSLPPTLAALTPNWLRLPLPEPMPLARVEKP